MVHRETLEERLQRKHCVRRRRIEESTVQGLLEIVQMNLIELLKSGV